MVHHMPISAPRPCTHPGCGVLVRDGTGRCPKHPKQLWAKKPDAPKRITGRKLQRLRAELFARDPLCAECKRQGRVKLATQRDLLVSLQGEQQRLAFARALLFAPQWLYMDEATSAMDEEDEASLYQALIDELPGLSIISVGHRSTLLEFHTHELEVLGEGKWRVQPLQAVSEARA